MNPVQNPLFKEPIGMTFKIRREQLGMTLDDVSKNLKFGAHLVHAIELEQWDKLGPSIYANSYINSYINLLELNPEIRHEIPRFKGDTTLKLIAEPRLSSSTSLSKAILAIVLVISLAAFIAFLYARHQPVPESMPSAAISISADIPSATMIAKNPLNQTQTISAPVPISTEGLASPITKTPSISKQLSIHASQAVRLEIRDSVGAVLFTEQVPANQDRTHEIKNTGKITLDNAEHAVLSIDGATQDLTPYITNGVANFTVNPDGKIAAITQ